MGTGNRDEGDVIHIEELELTARIGVPDEEREHPQRLTVCLTIWPARSFHDLEDQLANTINYAAVCREVKAFVSARVDKLIETLAEGMAAQLLRSFPIRKVRVEIRKFILPDVKFVAVAIVREKSSGR